jgi:hypothetical protein
VVDKSTLNSLVIKSNKAGIWLKQPVLLRAHNGHGLYGLPAKLTMFCKVGTCSRAGASNLKLLM